jgi:hypothetical protein
VWSGLQPFINTAHVVNGALVLATSLVLTLRSVRYRFAQVSPSVREQAAPARSVSHDRNALLTHPPVDSSHL